MLLVGSTRIPLSIRTLKKLLPPPLLDGREKQADAYSAMVLLLFFSINMTPKTSLPVFCCSVAVRSCGWQAYHFGSQGWGFLELGLIWHVLKGTPFPGHVLKGTFSVRPMSTLRGNFFG